MVHLFVVYIGDYAMFDIGYSSYRDVRLHDWSYEQQQAAANAREYDDAYLRAFRRATCEKIADSILKDYAYANGVDYYNEYGVDGDDASWQEWLTDAANETKDKDTIRAMQLFIDDGVWFTTLDYVLFATDNNFYE